MIKLLKLVGKNYSSAGIPDVNFSNSSFGSFQTGLTEINYVNILNKNDLKLTFLFTLCQSQSHRAWADRNAAENLLRMKSDFCDLRSPLHSRFAAHRSTFRSDPTVLADRRPTNGRAVALLVSYSVASVCRLSSSSVCTECIVTKRCVLEQKLLLRAYRKSYEKSIGNKMNDWPSLEVISRSCQPLPLCGVRRWISRNRGFDPKDHQ